MLDFLIVYKVIEYIGLLKYVYGCISYFCVSILYIFNFGLSCKDNYYFFLIFRVKVVMDGILKLIKD